MLITSGSKKEKILVGVFIIVLIGGVVFIKISTHQPSDVGVEISTPTLTPTQIKEPEPELKKSIISYACPNPSTTIGKVYRRLLSPDGKYQLIEISNFFPDVYIADISGNRLTGICPGSISSWTSDSTKALIFISGTDGVAERSIFFLKPNGDFYDSGLPTGTIAADISSDGSIVYSLTSEGTDRSDLYILKNNVNKKLFEGGDTIIGYPRWSPQANKIVFMRADLGLSTATRALWIINTDGTGLQRLSGIDWGNPPIWTKDGSKIIFMFNGKEQEVSIQ